MNLPKQRVSKLKSQRGQILVLFLLILVVGLAIVLSVASRTVTDIRTTTTSDESNRAYFAAEAGVEEALRQIDLGNTGSFPLNLNFDVSNSTADTKLTPGISGSIYIYPDDLTKDKTVQIMMASDKDDPDSGWDGDFFTIYWGAPDPADSLNQAIEVSIISYDGADFRITKAAFDPTSRGNGFCLAPPSVNTKTDELLVPSSGFGTTKTFSRQVVIQVRPAVGDLVPGCSDSQHGVRIPGEVVLIRVKALYNVSSSFPIAIETPFTDPIPAQGYVVESTGRTNSGVTRKLQVIRFYSSVSELFDYVLFNGGSNPLTKTNN